MKKEIVEEMSYSMKKPPTNPMAKRSQDDQHIELNIKGKNFVVTVEEDKTELEREVKFFHHKKSPMKATEGSRLLEKTIDNLKLHSRGEFENAVENSDSVWSTLPDSSNGTLIYMLLLILTPAPAPIYMPLLTFTPAAVPMPMPALSTL